MVQFESTVLQNISKKSHFFIKWKSQMFLRQKWPKMATDNIIVSFFASQPQCSSSFIVYGIQINVLTAWQSKEYFSVLYKWISHTVSNDAFFQKYLNVKNYFQILQCNFFCASKNAKISCHFCNFWWLSFSLRLLKNWVVFSHAQFFQ